VLVGVGIGAVLLVAVAVAFGFAVRAGAGPSAPPRVATSSPGFPSPPQDAVVLSRQAGSDVLALAVVPHGGRTLVQASVVGPDGAGVVDLSLEFVVPGLTTPGKPCGPGCYRASLPARPPVAVEVVSRGRVNARWHVALPRPWPPADASRTVAGAERAWRRLRSLSYTERIASDETHALTSRWTVEAPNRLTYRIVGGSEAVIVGRRRWDRTPGGRWQESSQYPVEQPTPLWSKVTDAHVLGTATVRGRPALRVSFFDPATPAWFTVDLERRTQRTLALTMITAAHFMHDVFGAFDATPAIRPPASG
jgi:hypothetical protein